MTTHDEDFLQPDGSLMVLGYGSLMWQPDFEHRASFPVWLDGWHRRFSLYSTMAWGSEEAPGLSLGIYPGGRLLGMVLHVDAGDAAQVLAYLDEREAAYFRKSVDTVTLDGGRHQVMTYVPDPVNQRWRPDLSLRKQADLIRQGIGFKGSSRSYLENTVGFLERHGVTEGDMHDLLALV